MYKFAITIIDITLKNNPSCGFPAYVLDERLQVTLGGLPNWKPFSCIVIYLVHSPSHAVSAALVLNPETGHVSPQFHVVFDDKFSTAPFIKEGTIIKNCTYIV